MGCEFICDCITPVFSTRNWTFPKATTAEFIVLPDPSGEWRYNFHLEFGIDLTMSKLLKHPDFKNLRIISIRIDGSYHADTMKPVNDVGMEKLLKFVSVLANEPEVYIKSQNTNDFSSPEGAVLLTWLEQRCFSEITFWTYHSAFNRLLEKQFSRRIPTNIFLHRVIGDKQFLADQLISGLMTHRRAHHIDFSSDVMEGIIQSFLQSPSEKKLEILASFDDSTEGHLREMEEGGLCRRIDRKFIFENPFHRLEVSRISNSFFASTWTCVTVKSE